MLRKGQGLINNYMIVTEIEAEQALVAANRQPRTDHSLRTKDPIHPLPHLGGRTKNRVHRPST